MDEMILLPGQLNAVEALPKPDFVYWSVGLFQKFLHSPHHVAAQGHSTALRRKVFDVAPPGFDD